MTLVLAARIDDAISVSDARASLSLFFQLEHRQNKGRLVLVSGANGVSLAATLVEANITLVGLTKKHKVLSTPWQKYTKNTTQTQASFDLW